MSPIQRRCVIEATIADLRYYRRGYARSKLGPFYSPATVRALLRTGALRSLGFIPPRLTAFAPRRRLPVVPKIDYFRESG